jgi:hypothetical protein
MWGVTDRILYVPLPGDLESRTTWASRHELVIEVNEELGRVRRTAAILRARQKARDDRPPAGHRGRPFLLLPGATLARRLLTGLKIHTGGAVALAAAGTTAIAAGVAITTTPPQHHSHHQHPATGSAAPAAIPAAHQGRRPATDTHTSRSLPRHQPQPSPPVPPSAPPRASPPPLLPGGLLPTSLPLPSLPAPIGGLLPTSLPLPPLGTTASSAARHLLRALTALRG